MEHCIRNAVALLALAICLVASHVEADKMPYEAISMVTPHNYTKESKVGRVLFLVQPPPVVLTYHGGAILTAPMVPVYLIWVGAFSPAQRGVIHDFFASFGTQHPVAAPSVSSWWKLLASYKNSKGMPAASSLGVAGEVFYRAQYAKPVTELDIQGMVTRSLKKFPAKPDAIYVVFTDPKVQVENFCMNSCGSHYASNPAKTKGQVLPYIWLGNPAAQCPGLCAWPYAKPAYGPPNFVPLLPPNHDVGLDGMIINLASLVAGTATNPFDTGFFQGDATAPLEAATACTGIYGTGSYPGFPGQLLKASDGSSYNVNGVNNRKFLVSAVVDVHKNACVPA